MYLCVFLLATMQILLIQEYGCIENVALRKPAQQKSTLYHADEQYASSAWRAVDGGGGVNDEPEEGCSSTEHGTDTDAWWMVYLQGLYTIVNVTVRGKEDSYERLRDFYIRVGNSSDITQHVYCAYRPGWVGLRQETFRCNSTLVGSWVSIQRTNDKGHNDDGGQGWLQLCEVLVFGNEKKLPTLNWGYERTARPVENTTHIQIIFYQFKKGPYDHRDSGDGPVGEYTVDVQGRAGWVTIASVKHDDTKDRLDVTVTGLKYASQYTMRVVPWYQLGDVKLQGRSERTFKVKTSCGNPEKPVITNITAKRVSRGAEMTIRFTLPKYGHNCAIYRKVDIRQRVLNSIKTRSTTYYWFPLEDQTVKAFIAEMNMTKLHEVNLRVYNNKDKWTESEIRTFIPIRDFLPNVTTTVIPWRPPTIFTVTTSNRRRSGATTVYSGGPTPDIISQKPCVNNKSILNTGTITGAATSAVFLIIIVALLLYICRLKRGTRTNPATLKGKQQVKEKQVSSEKQGNQDENIRAEVPGMDVEYKNTGLSRVEYPTYVNMKGNKYENLEKQHTPIPETGMYINLGPT